MKTSGSLCFDELAEESFEIPPQTNISGVNYDLCLALVTNLQQIIFLLEQAVVFKQQMRETDHYPRLCNSQTAFRQVIK